MNNVHISTQPLSCSTEFKLSRKREREVSLEPATTPSATNESEAHSRENKDSRTPLKKNRRRLDPTQEEEDVDGSGSGSGSGSPPTVTMTSPRQEMKIKVRQISQGVEDITWRNLHSSKSDMETIPDVDSDTGPGLLPSADITQRTDAHDNEHNASKTPEEQAAPLPAERDPKNDKAQAVDVTMHSDAQKLQVPHQHSQESETVEQGAKKRKFLERGTSVGPSENGETATHPPEQLKRPRDEADQDANPRVSKRPTPPPSPPPTSPPSPKVAKMSGFMAYASTSSPFASVKGQNVFKASTSTSPSPWTAGGSTSSITSSASTPASEFKSVFGKTTSTSAFGGGHTPSANVFGSANSDSSAGVKRSGFDAFSSSTSPFGALARSKSPVLGSTSKLSRAKSPPRRSNSINSNPFGSYAGGSQSFTLPVQKRARADSPSGSGGSSLERVAPALAGNGSDSGNEDEGAHSPTFSERLRAEKDGDAANLSDEEKASYSEQDVATGEEEDETIHQVRGKLFSLHDSQWKERGTGLLKLNVKRSDGTGARLVMRKDAVYTLLLNITLFNGMRFTLAQDPRYIRFSAIENGNTTTYNLKVSNAKIARDLLDEINANIPA
ncbi:hypothetical protein CVT24_008419 [Panaeolus cyanescens]|uniref:RanBD1 domain-containing protein n=1 Tax=Panaeolus cyanescens TaxID=181874 RepID=A0A409VEG9_9AGAR|nr:hypothetical protein CVT24_008419 [Panaeolus cyanescens]